MTAEPVSVRAATAADSPLLLAWRNDPVTRAASVSAGEVSAAEHEAWFARVLASQVHRLYLAERGKGSDPVGMVRFDLDPDAAAAEVSINLNPAFRGQGLGLPVLRAAIDAFDAATGGDVRLDAVIRPSNTASIRLFIAAGFAPAGGDEDLRRMVRG